MARVEPVDLGRIRLAGGYPLSQLDRLIRDLAPALYPTEPAFFEVDLSGLVHLSPTGIALLSASLRRLLETGLVKEGSSVVPPRSDLTHTYLLRLDVIRHLVGDDVQEPFERHEPVGFRPCQHFVDENGCHQVSREMTAALVERCKTDSVSRGSIRICLDELCENVIHHAESLVGGFAAAQGWRGKRNELEVGIVDLGRGIRASLTNNPEYADIENDMTAIETALQPKVTATPERNSGLGLAITRLLLRDNGGRFVVRSGDGGVYSGLRRLAMPALSHSPVPSSL